MFVKVTLTPKRNYIKDQNLSAIFCNNFLFLESRRELQQTKNGGQLPRKKVISACRVEQQARIARSAASNPMAISHPVDCETSANL